MSSLQTFLVVFSTVFVAEIGDKTQIATMLFAADGNTSRWTVFFGAAAALVLAAGIGVLAGAALERFVSPATLKLVAGIGFVIIGVWTILSR